MNDVVSEKMESRFAFAAFFCSLFLFFTPFELQTGAVNSMLPRYLVAGIAIVLLAPLVALRPIKLKIASVLVLIALCTIIFHAIFISPVPAQFLLLISANLVLAIALYETSFNWRKEFVSAASLLLIVNATVISLQASLFYVFSHGIFDFHKLIFGSHSRFTEDFLNIARFSGLQIEPGTYANFIACLLAILMLASDFTERILWISFFSVISIFLTNSGSSIYFVPVLMALLAYLWRKKIRISHIAILLVAIATYLYFSGVISHMEARFMERDDGSLSHRFEGIHAYLTTSLEEKIFGVGFGADPCVRCYYQDIGVTFNLLTRGGSIVAIALALLLFRSIAVNGIVLSTILFLIPLNEKMFFYEMPIWLFMLFAANGLRSPKSPEPVREDRSHLQLAGIFR